MPHILQIGQAESGSAGEEDTEMGEDGEKKPREGTNGIFAVLDPILWW